MTTETKFSLEEHKCGAATDHVVLSCKEKCLAGWGKFFYLLAYLIVTPTTWKRGEENYPLKHEGKCRSIQGGKWNKVDSENDYGFKHETVCSDGIFKQFPLSHRRRTILKIVTSDLSPQDSQSLFFPPIFFQ